MSNFLQEHTYELEGIFRLFISAVLGGVMGLERTRKRRDAGFRTYMLVALGSTMTVIIGEIMFIHYGSADTTRLAAAAVSGVGFIGAGSIIVSRSNRVKGLTTAAGLWVSVSVGLAIGCGYYLGGVALVIVSMVVTMFGENIQERFLRRNAIIRISILFSGEEFVLPFISKIQEAEFEIASLDLAKPISSCVSATMLLHVTHSCDHAQLLENIRAMSGVAFVECI